MRNPIAYFKNKRTEKNAQTFAAFAHEHKDLVLISLDPKTDEIIVSFKDKYVRTHIKNATGKLKSGVVRSLMYESQFKDSMDGVIVALVDILKVHMRLPAFSQVGNVLDGALYNISKSLRKPAKPVAQTGLTPSPYAESAGRPQI